MPSLQALNTSINDYLASMYSEGALNEEQAAQSAGMLYILCDIDRIGVKELKKEPDLCVYLPDESG